MTAQRGWMPNVVRIPTNNFGYSSVPSGGMTPTAIVNHIAQGFIRTIDGWARNDTNIAPHFGITRGGEIHQYVSIFDPAYHAGRLDDGAPPTWPGYQGHNPNKYTVGIEFEGFSVPPGYGFDFVYSAQRPWPEPMVEAGIRVHQWVFGELPALVPDTSSVIAHREIAPRSRAHDPGEHWPQARIIAACAPGGAETSPALTRQEALELMVLAFERDTDVRFEKQPVEGTRRVYKLSAPN